MENPLKSLVPKDSQGEGMGRELGEKARQVGNARQALGTVAPVEAAKSTIGKPAPMLPAQGPYGSGPGEKRIDTSTMTKPLGQMHKGGTVPKTGPYIMKAGEKVLTPEQHGHLKSALSLAQTALSHDPAKDDTPELPKHLREMHIKELHTGGFHVTKHDGKGGTTDHGAPHNDSVIEHFMGHMAHPDEDEEDVQAGNHDMHAADSEHRAIGLAHPSRYDEGGTVQKTGMALVHEGEKVIPNPAKNGTKTPDFNPMAKSGPKDSDFKSPSIPDPRGNGTKTPDFNPKPALKNPAGGLQ